MEVSAKLAGDRGREGGPTIPAHPNVASRPRFAALFPASDPAVGLEAIQFTVTPLPRSQLGKAGIEFGMQTVVVGHSWSRQAALGGDKAVDPA